MSQQLTIELPDHIFQQLSAEATVVGKTVAERVSRGVERPPGYGRVRRLAGCIDTGLGDVSARYRDYLAEEMTDPHEGKPDGGPVR